MVNWRRLLTVERISSWNLIAIALHFKWDLTFIFYGYLMLLEMQRENSNYKQFFYFLHINVLLNCQDLQSVNRTYQIILSIEFVEGELLLIIVLWSLLISSYFSFSKIFVCRWINLLLFIKKVIALCYRFYRMWVIMLEACDADCINSSWICYSLNCEIF